MIVCRAISFVVIITKIKKFYFVDKSLHNYKKTKKIKNLYIRDKILYAQTQAEFFMEYDSRLKGTCSKLCKLR